MKTIKMHWREELEYLTAETIASEKAFADLAKSDKYPKKQAYFKKRHLKQHYFTHVLSDENYVQNGGKSKKSDNMNAPVFNSLENDFSKANAMEREVDLLLLEKELDLIVMYQRVLAHRELPNVTAAILSSQAADLNVNRQALQLNYRIVYGVDAPYA